MLLVCSLERERERQGRDRLVRRADPRGLAREVLRVLAQELREDLEGLILAHLVRTVAPRVLAQELREDREVLILARRRFWRKPENY